MVHPAPRDGAADAPRARMPALLWTVRIARAGVEPDDWMRMSRCGRRGAGFEGQASIWGAITPANHS